MQMQTVGAETLEASVAIGFAEQPSGEGRSIIIQFPFGVDEEDHEADEDGLSGYCVSTETGATHYRGIERVDLHMVQQIVEIAFTEEAAEELGLDRVVQFQITPQSSRALGILHRLQELATQEGINVNISNGSTAPIDTDAALTQGQVAEPPVVATREPQASRITISLAPEGSEQFGADLIERLGQPDLAYLVEFGSASSMDVRVAKLEDCDRLAAAIASWVATTKSDFSIVVEGSTETSRLRMIRTPNDKAYLYDSIASAAQLI